MPKQASGVNQVVWQLLRAPIAFRRQQYADHRAISILMMAITTLAGASLWIWDYAHDPVGATGTIWLRLVIVPTAAPYLLALILNWDHRSAALCAAFTFAGWEWGFLEILNRLDDGMTYGLAGFLYFLFMPFLIARGCSLPVNLSLTAGIVLFPLVLHVGGLAPRLPVEKYVVLLVPAATMCVFAAFAFSRAYWRSWYDRARLESAVLTDSMTGLCNRRSFVEAIRCETERIASRPFGVLTLDLDHFKEVNDAFGHAAGDELLMEVARRLRSCERHGDMTARLGGDEFAMLFYGAPGKDELAEVANLILRKLTQPVVWMGREINVSASIGIACYPDNSSDPQEILKNADDAMYRAKSTGRNRYQLYDAELMARTIKRMMIDATLKKALQRDEFELYYQPQVLLPSGLAVGAEALLRWNHAELGFLTPDRFISIAEESGIILDIGRWVIESACRAAVNWNSSREEAFVVSVNVSARQIIHDDLVSVVARALAVSGCKPHWLCLEITESVLLEDKRGVKATLDALKQIGVSIAVDDFGTGYSALSYLNNFPIDVLKLDQSFVRELGEDRRKTKLVGAIIGIAKALDLKLVAEGVETKQQSEILEANECWLAQGYLYGKPMPAATFTQMISPARERYLCA
ncbi:putative bifunctional diguanylate cyclase/phosphodiesterase [Bradyrhizobium manausense]|uniref:putative bifunctional diguanylate cyclase/phosphodiesterase n=1 Tax=Bradyrhizobium manausense TaxID=989370 RepID=UPI00201113AF|nr:EAL domain-containing protein [Bradyrhizobium manausense]